MGIAGSTSSACPRVGVDLFHVPHMLGEETYHLVALREDCDTRSLPEAKGQRCLEDGDLTTNSADFSSKKDHLTIKIDEK